MSAWRAIKLHTTTQTQRSIAPLSAARDLDAVAPRARVVHHPASSAAADAPSAQL